MNQQDIRWQQRFTHYQKALLHKIDDPDLLDHIRRVGVVFYENPEK